MAPLPDLLTFRQEHRFVLARLLLYVRHSMHGNRDAKHR